MPWLASSPQSAPRCPPSLCCASRARRRSTGTAVAAQELRRYDPPGQGAKRSTQSSDKEQLGLAVLLFQQRQNAIFSLSESSMSFSGQKSTTFSVSSFTAVLMRALIIKAEIKSIMCVNVACTEQERGCGVPFLLSRSRGREQERRQQKQNAEGAEKRQQHDPLLLRQLGEAGQRARKRHVAAGMSIDYYQVHLMRLYYLKTNSVSCMLRLSFFFKGFFFVIFFI